MNIDEEVLIYYISSKEKLTLTPITLNWVHSIIL